MSSDDQTPRPPESVPIHERIRRRREERGIPAYVLAERLGISPSYISLIESGKKVPSEEIARRIAQALDDDEEIYAAWVHSAGIDDLDVHTTRLMRLRRYSSDPALRRRLESGADFDDLAHLSEPDEAADDRSPALSRGIVPFLLGKRRTVPAPAEVVLLEEGTDPEARGRDRRIAGPPLRLDARLFDAADVDRLFAYRATPATAARVGDAIRAGDWVILSSRVDPKALSGIFAVRIRGTIVLSRVLSKGAELLLLPPAGSSELDTVELPQGGDARGVLAGRVVRVVS